MSFLEKGWFKKGEDKESLQDAIDSAVEKDKVAHIITKETLHAAKNIDDQEQNIAAQAGEEKLEIWKSEIDLGDIVSVTGEVITSKRGELSILANSFTLAAKSLRPLPVEHKPLSEESRVRMRYLDLIVRPEARSNARLRPAVMRSLRDTFNSRSFLEVETPMLQVMHGGAAARPFKTFSNAYERCDWWTDCS